MDSAQRKGINFEIPWLNYCVSVCTISDVPELFDISYVFEREAQQLLKKQVQIYLNGGFEYNIKAIAFFYKKLA